MKATIRADYRRLRAAEYPLLAEGLDALVKKDLGDPQPWKDYVARCAAVKAKFPKPDTTKSKP